MKRGDSLCKSGKSFRSFEIGFALLAPQTSSFCAEVRTASEGFVGFGLEAVCRSYDSTKGLLLLRSG